MSKVAIGVVAGVAVAGAVGFGTLVYPNMRAKQEVDKAIAELPAEVKASYRDVRYSLFSRKLTIGGLEMVVEDGGQSISTRVESLSLTDVAKDRVGQVQGAGLVLETADRSLRAEVGKLSGDGLAAPIGMLAAMGVPAAPNTAMGAINIKNLTLSDVSIDAEGEKVKLREIAIADYVQTDKTPLSMTFGVHGIQIDPAALPDAEAREGLAKLGYDRLSLDLDLSYVHNPDTKRLSVKQVSVGGDNMGRVGLSFDLGNVNAALAADPAMDPAAALMAVQSATLERLELRYDDSSLAGRLLKAAASEAGMEEADFKSMLLAQVAQAGAQAPEAPMTKDVLDSAVAFINNPKSLSLRLQPPQPVAVGALMAASQDPIVLAQAVGMSVTANK